MKPEKEVLWIVKLLKARKFSGCKSEYERIAGASDKNKVFRNWIGELIDSGILESDGNKDMVGGVIAVYKINRSKLIKRLKDIPCWIDISDIAVEIETILGI